MNREKLNTKNENFIGCWNIEDDQLFSDLINFFEENKQLHQQGAVRSGLNNNMKKTTDLTIYPKHLKNNNFFIFNRYFDYLHKCYEDYKSQWPYLSRTYKKIEIPSFNIQKYNPGDHFSHIHCERESPVVMHRLFAWMTYLNDLKTNNGNTNFVHYDIKVRPKRGKTLIWPAEWTHAHSGEILKEETKYIITGWMCLPVMTPFQVPQ